MVPPRGSAGAALLPPSGPARSNGESTPPLLASGVAMAAGTLLQLPPLASGWVGAAALIWMPNEASSAIALCPSANSHFT